MTVLGAASWWSRLWFRESGSTFVPSGDALFYFIFWVSAIAFVALMGAMIWFGVIYRRSKVGDVAEVSTSHNTALEITWSVIPAIVMAVMFYWGFRDYLYKLIAPADSMNVYVTAYQWGWDFTYPDGGSTIETELIGAKESPVIAFPAGKPTKLIMTSRDVIHSFYVPAFRTKRDIFPNRYTTLWFEPTDRVTHEFNEDDNTLVPVNPNRPGYYLFCAEYCGDQHSQMVARVAVLSGPDYVKWRKAQLDTSGIPLHELGAILYVNKGCAACHSVDGSRNTGPTWQGIWGTDDHAVGWEPPPGSDAEPGVVGPDYVRQSILDPSSYIVPGYPNQMNSYQGQVTERELLALITYIKWLNPDYRDEAEADSASELVDQAADGAEATGGE